MELRRVRRKIKWGRLIVFIMVIGLLGALAGQAYIYVRECIVKINPVLPANVQARHAAAWSERTNILLISYKDEGQTEPIQSSDTVILSINHSTGQVELFFVPRDTRVVIPGRIGLDKIANAYLYGGSELTIQAIESLMQTKIHYCASVDYQEIARLIDAMGGIDVYVEQNMDYEDTQLVQGYQRLNGLQAQTFLSFRNDDFGDLRRVQRQQRFAKSVFDRFFDYEMLPKLPWVIEAIQQNLHSDLLLADWVKLGYNLRQIKVEAIESEIIPGKLIGENGANYWIVDAVKLKQREEARAGNPGS